MSPGLLLFKGGMDRGRLSIGDSELNLMGGEDVPLSLDTFGMVLVGVPVGVPGGVHLKASE